MSNVLPLPEDMEIGADIIPHFDEVPGAPTVQVPPLKVPSDWLIMHVGLYPVALKLPLLWAKAIPAPSNAIDAVAKLKTFTLCSFWSEVSLRTDFFPNGRLS
jgi:hypothetical protein